MAKRSYVYTDLGLEDILKEMEKLKSMCVKVGVTEDVGSKKGMHRVRKTLKSGKKSKQKVKVENTSGPTIAQYASWNELGVKNEGGGWLIPPRPFVRGFADGKREQIAKTLEKVGKLVSEGKHDADTAIRRIGEYGQDGIKSYIRNGEFTPNADSTIAKKRSSKPLIDTGTMRNSIRYQVIDKPVDMVSEK
jgi:hypothetical protein